MKKLLAVLCLIFATFLVSCSPTTNQNTTVVNTSKIENNNKDVLVNNPATEIDRALVLAPCPEAGYDATIPEHKFSCEFQQAILKFSTENNVKDEFGNWFGRLVAFGYKFNIQGTTYTEENDGNNVTKDEFRRKLRDKEIKLVTYSTNFSTVRYDPRAKLITASVEIRAKGTALGGTYNISYKVKDAGWEAEEIIIR